MRSRDAFVRLVQLRQASDSGQAYQQLRDELIVANLNLVYFLAGRFAGRGEPFDDLVQVGMIGLLKAIDRYEPERGFEFATFATPTIVGEIKRYFRDKGWSIRVPRRLQELVLGVNAANERLAMRFGRHPTIAELATELNAREDEIVEAMDLAQSSTPLSLEAEMHDDDSGARLADRIASEDDDFAVLENRERVTSALRMLGGRERAVLELRYYESMSQAEVAKHLGVSQMHVSRIQSRALDRLRAFLRD